MRSPAAAAALVACAASIFASAAPATATIAAVDEYVTYDGVAKARQSSKVLYGERDMVMYRDGAISQRVVLYLCESQMAAGSPFARKTVTYGEPLAPDFLLEDSVTGMREGVRGDGAARFVFFRPSMVKPEKVAPLPRATGLVADAGFDEFIRTNWQLLMSGHLVPMHFLLPSRLGDLASEAQHVRSEVIDGTATEVFRLKLAGLLQLVGPSIDAYYSTTDHMLLRYDGLSDLRDTSGENLRAVIDYSPAEHRVSDAASMAAARQARLVPCK